MPESRTLGAPHPDHEARPPENGGAAKGRPCQFLGTAADATTFYWHASEGNRCHATTPPMRIDLAHQSAYCYAACGACSFFKAAQAAGEPGAPVAVVLGEGDAARAIGAAGAGAHGLEIGEQAAHGRNGGTSGNGHVHDPAGAQTNGAGTNGAKTNGAHTNGAKTNGAKTNGAEARGGDRGGASGGQPPRELEPALAAAAAAVALAGADPGAAMADELAVPDDDYAPQTALEGFFNGVLDRGSRLSFEAWTTLIVGGGILAAVGYSLVFGNRHAQRPEDPVLLARAAALSATETPEPTPLPTYTPRPTKPPEELPRETPQMPVAPAGGQVIALTPGEREVASVNDEDRLPSYGDRELHVGRYADHNYFGIVAFPLTKIETATRVDSAQLELVGLSDSQLQGTGTWTIEMLPDVVDQQWSDLSYDLVRRAPSLEPPISWQVDGQDLRTGGVSVLPFDEAALAELTRRLKSDRPRVSFRITGPEIGGDGPKDNLFTFDTGYGDGFGTRPVLRVAYVAPPPTARPISGGGGIQPTPLPLIIWDANPTPAPTPTALPDRLPGVLDGMILFLSDRFGQNSLIVYDPGNDRFGRVTQSWTYSAAQRDEVARGDSSIATFSRPCGEVAGRSCAQVVLKDAAGEREVTQPGYMNYDAAFAPDGTWIAYASNATGNDEIFKIHPDGTGNTRLTDNLWEWDKHPSFSPDGSQIVFWSNRDGRKQIYLMNADGTGQRNLSNSPFNDWDPVWVK